MSRKMKKPRKVRRTTSPGGLVGRPRKTRALRITPGRGTASVQCPTCDRPTRVLRTARVDGAVQRERVCARNHRFRTTEAAR